MPDIVKECIEERDRQILMGVIHLKGGVGSSLLVPQNPSGEEGVED
jgi:hypothetical protein